MADFDSQLPVRAIATQFTTEVADSGGVTINPATEDGHLANIDTATASLDTDIDVALSTRASEATLASVDSSLTSIDSDIDTTLSSRASEATLSSIDGKLNSLGQKTMANSVPVVIASDQSAIPVTFTPSAVVELPQYNTASAIAAAASSTQTYSPGSTVSLDGVDASASGQLKVEIQYGTTGAEVTKAVFFTSKGNLQLIWRLPNPVSITNTMSVKVIRTNLDNQAMDVYSTIQVH